MSERSGDLSGDEQNSGLSLSPGASLGSSSAEGELPVCRDYLRNVCKRGKRCKFRHPTTVMSDSTGGNGGAVPPSGGSDSSVGGGVGEMNGHCTMIKTVSDVTSSLGRPPTRDPLLGNLNFCHDFQNAGCRRPNCKFLHCTREEEEYYKQTGQLPLHLQHLVALGIGLSHTTDMPLARGEIPVCKDHLKGGCRRGNKCKFRHVSQTDLDLELLARTHAPNLSAINMAAAGHVTAPPSVTPGAVLPVSGPAVPISTTPATVSPATAHAAAAASAHHLRGCSLGFNMGTNGVLFDSQTASFMLDPTNPAGAAAAMAAAAAANYPTAGATPCATPGPGTPAPGSDPLFEFVKRRRLEASLEAAPAAPPPPALHTVLHTPSFTPSFVTATPLPPTPATTGLGAYGAVDNGHRLFAAPQMTLGGGGDEAGILRKKYDELRRVNADLMAANDLLLEQNAHLRNKLADHANLVAASVASTVAQVRNPIASAAHTALSVVNSLSQRDPIPAVAAVLAPPPNPTAPPQACPVTCVPAPSLSSNLVASHLSVSLAAATNGVPPPPPPPNAGGPTGVDLATFSGSNVIPPPPPPPQSAPGNAASAMGPPPPPAGRAMPGSVGPAAWLTGVIPAVGLQ